MERYETKKFDSFSESKALWDELLDTFKELRLSPFYSFKGYNKGSFKSYSISFMVKSNSEAQILNKLRKKVELFKINC
jgi:hypothetical protein|tara:strand:- start:637 stop:870 length:234 start_codon:yes stop_codon:yes gene_type:complete